MNNPVQKAVTINLFLKYRIFFGYYHNVSRCGFKRLLLKFLSVLLGAAILSCGIRCAVIKQNDLSLALQAIKYLANVTCALTTENGFLIIYFNANIFDDNLYSKKIYHKIHTLIMYYILFVHIFYTVLGLLFYFSDNSPCGGSFVDFLALFYFDLAAELGFMPVILILFLFYLRTSFLCTKIRREAVHFTTTFNWKNNVNLYIQHIETLEKTDWPIKFMMLLHLIVSFYDISKTQFEVVLLYKNNALILGSLYNMCILIVYILSSYTKAFCPAIIMEFTLNEMDILKIEIADKMISCSDARRKEQLYKLLTRFHSRPLTYTLWRTFRIDSSLPLKFLSLSATCLVCLLQFSHVLEK